MKKLIAVLVLIVAILVGHKFSDSTPEVSASTSFHSDFELAHFSSMSLTMDSAFMFSGSGVCVECHGSDPDGLASVTLDGIDINVVDDWRATMMANSSKDPLWRAKVSHEVLVNPSHQNELETKCTSCHAPMGHFQAMYEGQSHYTISEMLTDSLALDGVSCLACHKQQPDSMGLYFSGELIYDTLKNAYGPYQSPLAGPMIGVIGYWPVFHEKYGKSEVCAGCHTLITNTADLNGNLTGGEFVEQATYQEWVNSSYNDVEDCQDCHMPEYDGNVRLIAGYEGIPPRMEFSQHQFAGANKLMLSIMKEHAQELGIDATPAQFDSVLARTTRMLTMSSVEMTAVISEITTDTIFADIELLNLAGHKFPSGYPSRRAVLEVVLLNDVGDTLFQSGTLNSNYEAFGQNPTYEPHYNMINSEDDVQIYELVIGDVNGDVTTVLERADHPIKDNRLAPIGFSTSHPSYDTTELAGAVLSDPNFNDASTGTDVISYHMPVNGYAGDFTLSARLLYQTLPPKWNDEMFSYNSAEIDTFRNMYFDADREPIVVDQISLQDGPESSNYLSNIQLNVYPNPASDKLLVSGNATLRNVEIADLSGKILLHTSTQSNQLQIDVSELKPGIYFLMAGTGNQAIRFVVH